MSNTIFFYSDASYKNNKCGYAFCCFTGNKDTKFDFIYGNCSATSSMEAELIAVIKVIEYIIQYHEQIDNTYYVIKTDQLSIVEFITKKVYKRLNEFGWKDSNGVYRKSNAELWHKLMCLYELFPKGVITLKKAESKADKINYMVDRIAKFIADEELTDYNCSFIVKNSNSKAITSRKVFPTTININEFIVKQSIEEIGTENKKINWLESFYGEFKYLPVEEILVVEKEHLKCKNINFNGMLEKIYEKNEITTPVVVKKIDEYGKYSLISGVTRLFSAKILGVKKIPVIITEMEYKEFIEKHIRPRFTATTFE